MAKKKKGQRPITIFSVLALFVLIGGGATTLVVSFLHLDAWMQSGARMRIGTTQMVELPAGELVVFFESPTVLPGDPNSIHLFVHDASGTPLQEQKISHREEEVYAPPTLIGRSNVFGAPLWRVQVPAAGVYSIRVQNDHEEQNPDQDRAVIGKSPQSFAAAMEQANQIRMTGLGVTGAVFLLLYIVHMVALSRRSKTAESEVSEVNDLGLPMTQNS